MQHANDSYKDQRESEEVKGETEKNACERSSWRIMFSDVVTMRKERFRHDRMNIDVKLLSISQDL